MDRLSTGPGLERDQGRFWSKVGLPNGDGCMPWLAAPKDGKYGGFWLDGRTVRAHIYSFELAYGPPPTGTVIDHVRTRGCRNKLCVAPWHLEAVTPGENIRRAKSETCPAGHPREAPHLAISKEGWRSCRTCKQERERKR